jgi:hypothetical protein
MSGFFSNPPVLIIPVTPVEKVERAILQRGEVAAETLTGRPMPPPIAPATSSGTRRIRNGRRVEGGWRIPQGVHPPMNPAWISYLFAGQLLG